MRDESLDLTIMERRQERGASASGTWTFFTNHLFVLACVAANPDVRAFSDA
jgi:hypothetical protein